MLLRNIGPLTISHVFFIMASAQSVQTTFEHWKLGQNFEDGKYCMACSFLNCKAIVVFHQAIKATPLCI
jgi:hypothetical protein